MSRKTNLKILKIFGAEDWLSRGFYKKNLAQRLKEDFEIRKFLENFIIKGIIESIEIEREEASLKIIIKTSRPALVIGRNGEMVEKIKKGIKKIINQPKEQAEKTREKGGKELKIDIVAVKNPWSSAKLASSWATIQLEKRVPYRRVLKMTLSKIMYCREVEGARVEVSGRLNGVEISRKEWLQEGKLPRQRVEALIDYGFSQAYCSYGVIGVKVWIYKGEREKN